MKKEKEITRDWRKQADAPGPHEWLRGKMVHFIEHFFERWFLLIR